MFLKRFTFDGGIAYHPFTYKGGYHQIAYGTDPSPTGFESEIGESVEYVKSKYFGISTMDGIRFELTKNISLLGTISTALYGIDQIMADLGINYRFSVFPKGRWVFLDLGLAATVVNSKISICSISNAENNMLIDGKTFDSGSIEVKAGNSGTGAKGVAGLAVRMGKKYELFVDGSYYLPLLFKRDYVQFREADGFFLSRKSVKVKWDNPDLFYYIGSERQTTPRFEVDPYHFRIGIRSGF
jgi:hypothetical protein